MRDEALPRSPPPKPRIRRRLAAQPWPDLPPRSAAARSIGSPPPSPAREPSVGGQSRHYAEDRSRWRRCSKNSMPCWATTIPSSRRSWKRSAFAFRPVLTLDGSDDAWTETGLTLDGAFTVETWVRLAPGIGNEDGILGAPGQLDINFYDAKLRVWVGGAVHDAIIAKKPITPDLWTHVAVDPRRARAFQNLPRRRARSGRNPNPLRKDSRTSASDGPARKAAPRGAQRIPHLESRAHRGRDRPQISIAAFR